MRRVAAAVLHFQEVADGVVHIALDVRAHGIPVVRAEVAGRIRGQYTHSARVVVRVGNGYAALTEVLTAVGLDQSVDGVVGVVVARLDALVLEIDRLLRIVLYVCDVAGGVVGVVQVLHLTAGPAGRWRLR